MHGIYESQVPYRSINARSLTSLGPPFVLFLRRNYLGREELPPLHRHRVPSSPCSNPVPTPLFQCNMFHLLSCGGSLFPHEIMSVSPKFQATRTEKKSFAVDRVVRMTWPSARRLQSKFPAINGKVAANHVLRSPPVLFFLRLTRCNHVKGVRFRLRKMSILSLFARKISLVFPGLGDFVQQSLKISD